MKDPWQDPRAQRWVKDVLADMAPKLRTSAISMTLVNGDVAESVKFWAEIGATICMNKPIILVVLGDEHVPPKLELVADEVVRVSKDPDDPAAQEAITAALTRVAADLEARDSNREVR